MSWYDTISSSMITDWKNKKIAIVGLGIEGLATARFLRKKNIDVSILDKKRKDHIDQSLISEVKQLGCHLVLGEKYLEGLSFYNVIVRSPGIKLSTPELVAAKNNGAIIISQTKFFFDL